MTSIIITDKDCGKRLDSFLEEFFEQKYTRSHIKNLIENNQVFLNGKSQKAGAKLKTGDTVEYVMVEPKKIDLTPDDNVNFEIVWQDKDFLVINKPAGLVVHPSTSTPDKTLVNGLLAKVGDLSGINGEIRPGIVHRLDKDTTGLMIVAKNDFAHTRLAKQIETKICERKYYALLYGVLKNDEGHIETYLGRDKKDRKKMAVVASEKDGRLAITDYRVIKRYDNCTFCEFSLKTGRTHQIRVHAKHIGHFVIGDPLYGTQVKAFADQKTQLLHSHYLKVFHPRTGEMMEFEQPLPQNFASLIEKLDNK